MESSWIVTLVAGSSPLRLARPPAPELAHLDVFTSRTTEEGRDRFRLHLGYFDDVLSAAKVLGTVRESFPTAWVVPASRYRSLARLKGSAAAAALEVTPALSAPGLSEQLPELAVSLIVAEPLPSVELTRDDGPILETPEVLALLEGRAHLPDEVLPESSTVESMANDSSEHASPASEEASPAAIVQPFNASSRFTIEEWRPEVPRAAPPAQARAWYKRLPRIKSRAPQERASAYR
jgi:hypothetical protein